MDITKPRAVDYRFNDKIKVELENNNFKDFLKMH